MRRLLAFILIISHMNTSMFFPQVPEKNIYDSKGDQIDNITSIVEWVRVKTGLDHTADNENNNRAQNLHPVKTFQYTSDNYFTKVANKYSALVHVHYAEYPKTKILMPSYDILVPPPKA